MDFEGKMEIGVIITASIVVVCALVGFGAAYFSKSHDGLIEERMEEIIESQTGIDFDLTPSSDEKKD